MSLLFFQLDLAFFSYLLTIFLALILGTFLFWRAGKHELIDSELLFDFLVVSGAGALLFGRMFDFLANFHVYQWSLKRLIFFNVWGGFDFYGAIFGALLFGYLFLRKKKDNFWQLTDLGASPMVLGMSIVSLGNFLRQRLVAEMYYSLAYFFIFWILKRLETQKRHVGFFASFYLISIALVDILLFSFREDKNYLADVVPYQLLMPVIILILVLGFWHILAKRNIVSDFKSGCSFLLISLFGIKRILTSVQDADNFSKAIVLSPLILAKVLYGLAKIIWREFFLSIVDLLHDFGVKR